MVRVGLPRGSHSSRHSNLLTSGTVSGMSSPGDISPFYLRHRRRRTGLPPERHGPTALVLQPQFAVIGWTRQLLTRGVGAVMDRTVPEREEVQAWEAGLRALHERIGARFGRREPRQRALAYLKGLLGSVERKNGWQLAEYVGDATPDGVQRLLATYRWDADEVRDDLQEYVVEHLGDPEAVLVVDETGFLKQGRKLVGVQRQYSGTAGKVENCQIGVFLAYGSKGGRTFLDRELYLLQVWAEDWERRWEAGVPEEVAFRTKGQLARVMIARAVAAGVPFGWVAGDTVYGNDRRLRGWLEEQVIAYVLAVKSNESLWVDAEGGAAQVAAWQLAQQIPEEDWQRLSAGEGSKGPRLYHWGRVSIRPGSGPDQSHWLLVRRSIADPDDLAYYACFGPAGATLAELVRVAGHRWIIEDAFKEAKQEVGLDEYEVRRWTGWYRHITLALLVHAFLAVCRMYAATEDAKGGRH